MVISKLLWGIIWRNFKMVLSIIKNIIWACLSVLLITSCSSDDSTTELEGSWIEPCEIITNNTSWNTVLTFSGNTFVRIGTDFSDTTCSIPIPDSSRVTYSGTFVVGNSLTTSSGLPAREIDSFSPNEDPEYDIYHISSGKLYFGDYTAVKDGSSPANRPVDLDFSWYYTKG